MGALQKGMDPFSLAASGVSSIFNLGSTIATNRTNAKINAQNIAAAYNMQDKANAFSREMFAANNEEYDRRFAKESAYNSASAQRQRLEQAGLNPYLMMNGGSAGVGSSTPSSAPSGASGSVPSPIPMQAARIEDLGQAINASYSAKVVQAQARKEDAEANIAQSDAAVREARNQKELELMEEERRGREKDNIGKDIDNSFGARTLESRVRQAWQNEDYLDAQIQYMQYQAQAEKAKLPYVEFTAYSGAMNAFYQALGSKETVRLIKANTNEAYKRAALLVQQAAVTALQKEGVKLDNKQKADLMPILVDQARAQLEAQEGANQESGRSLGIKLQHDKIPVIGHLVRFLEYVAEPAGVIFRGKQAFRPKKAE